MHDGAVVREKPEEPSSICSLSECIAYRAAVISALSVVTITVHSIITHNAPGERANINTDSEVGNPHKESHQCSGQIVTAGNMTESFSKVGDTIEGY